MRIQARSANALIFFDCTHASARDIARSLAREGLSVHLISPNADQVFSLRMDGFSAYIPRDFFDEDEISALDRESFGLDEALFEHKGSDRSAFCGVSLMGLAQYALIPPLVRVRRDIASALRALERLNPAKIVIAGRDGFTEAARLACRHSGRDYENVGSGRMRSWLNSLMELYRQRGSGWNQTPFKYLVVEWVLEAWMLAEGLWARMRRGAMDSSRSGQRLVFVGDMYSGFDIHGMLKDSPQWELHTCGMDFRLRRRIFPDVRPIEVFFRPAMLWEMLKAHMHLRKQWSWLRRDRAFRARFEVQGVAAWDLVESTLGAYAKYYLPRLYLDYLIGRAAFRERAGRCVLIVPSDVMPYTKALVLAARAEGARSLVVQHSFLGMINGHERIHADVVAGWGEETANWYASLGNDPSKIKVIGSPRYDTYLGAGHVSGDEAREIRAALSIPQRKALITILTSWYNDFSICHSLMDDIMIIEHTLRAVSELGLQDECAVAIKTHPATPGLGFEREMHRWKALVPDISLHKGSLKDLMRISSFCIGLPSSTVIEAMLCGVPFITYEAMRYKAAPYVEDFARFEATANANSYADVRDAVRGYLLEPGFRERIIRNHTAYLERFLSPRDGKATLRLYDLVSSLASPDTALMA